ncbi:MAG: nucleotidyltransferase domain-containing protein [Acidobacteriota bacterium]
MSEFLLEEERWPAALAQPQRDRLRDIVSGLRGVPGVLGVAAGGSFVAGRMDEYSDLDLLVVVTESAFPDMRERRQELAAGLGPLLVAFTGEHVGEPRLLICLYGPPPVHVDLKFVTPGDLAARVEDPVVLWDRGGEVRRGLDLGAGSYPGPDWQWIEDRFWVWAHYAASKIGRGELFEALGFLAFLRGRVLGPILLAQAAARPDGVRRIEQAAPGLARPLEETVARYDPRDILRAARAAIALYRSLRENAAPPGLLRRDEAEAAAERYLEWVASRLGGA